MNGNDCDVATYKPISLNNKSSTDTAILDGANTSPTASTVNPPPASTIILDFNWEGWSVHQGSNYVVGIISCFPYPLT